MDISKILPIFISSKIINLINMKTKDQLIRQIKSLVTDGVGGMVWVNFTADAPDGLKYISGHNVYGDSITLRSDGQIFNDACNYKAGNFHIEGHNFDENMNKIPIQDMIHGGHVKFIDNSDYSKSAPSKDVRKFISEFEINI